MAVPFYKGLKKHPFKKEKMKSKSILVLEIVILFVSGS